MSVDRATPGDGMPPREVVLAAYRAANKGRYAAANGFVVPEIARRHSRLVAALAATNSRLERTAKRLQRRGEHQRAARISSLLRLNKTLVPLMHPHFCWKVATRGRTLRTVEATRQVIHGSRAKVYLRLELRGGRVEKDSEPLVLRKGKWLIG